MYKYEKALNIRVKRLHDTYYAVAKGNYKDVTASLSSTITDEYEKSAVNSVSKSVAVSSGTEATDGITKVSFQTSTSATKSVVSTIGETHSYTYNSGYSTTDHLEAIDHDRLYSWEIRANFEVYVSFLYEIEYTQKLTVKKTWYGKKYNTYTYSVKSLRYVESMYYYRFIEGTSCEGFYPYIYSIDDDYVFDGEKSPFLNYID